MQPIQLPQKGSLQLRIIALTLVFTLAAALVIVASNVRQLSQGLERGALQSAEYGLQTAAAAIRRDVEEVDALANWCTYDSTMRTYMLSNITARSLVINIYPTVSNKYNSMRTMPYIQRFLLHNDQGRRLLFGSNAAQSLAVTNESLRLLPGMGEGEADTAWEQIVTDPLMLPTQATQGIPITRTVQAASGVGRTARVYISVSPALITDPLKDFALAEGGTLYWCMGDAVYRVDATGLTDAGPLADFQQTLTPRTGETLDAATKLYTTQQDGEDLLVVAYPVGVHGLYLAEAIPNGPLRSQLPLMLGPLVISLLAIVGLGMALLVVMHRMVSRPVGALQHRIEAIGQGDFAPDASVEWDNELGDIGRGINSMAGNVTALMEKRIEDEKQKQDLEYSMLQNQINPHFIYNTLNSIKWMATIQHAPGIAEMVTALSRLLKSVSKGTERLVPLYEEFALLNDYFTIQQYRYGGTITLDVTYIEKESLTHLCRIPRFTLQPLVENAIFHGIEPKGCAGAVTLEVRQEPSTDGKPPGDVLLRLTDDGVGMTAEQVANALKQPGPEEAAAKFRHVGLWNVHRRLQYSFGPAYGLSLESEPGVGTTVVVRLPGPPAEAADPTPDQAPEKEEQTP